MPVTNIEFDKLRIREAPVFANINLLGKCNVDCYFCLGKDIDGVFGKHNNLNMHFSEWNNFDKFLDESEKAGIKRIYLTGQNTDALVYKYGLELQSYIQSKGFDFGIRTNGYLLTKTEKMDMAQKCRRNVGVSIHSLDSRTNDIIMKRPDIPNWEKILPQIPNLRISMVLNRYNEDEFDDLIKFFARFDNVKYVQIRRICTDTREEYLIEDVNAYERVFNRIKEEKGDPDAYFYAAEVYNLYGKECCFWRTVKTTIGSYNYYTDGTINKGYFVIEGYSQEMGNDDADPLRNEKLEGYWRK